jgi:hypothetical protein
VITAARLTKPVAAPFILRRTAAHAQCCGAYPLVSSTPSEYQNTIESAYGLLPRPPQTPAARFKRLYRK